MFLPKTLFGIATLLAIVLADVPFEVRRVEDTVFREDGVNYRLPNTSHPETYDISLLTRVDSSEFDFRGFVKIGIVVDAPTREIVLHTRQLTISSVNLIRGAGTFPEVIPLLPWTFENVPEFLRIKTNGTDLRAGDRLVLEIIYNGVLRTDNAGFYRSSYISPDGTKVWLATTQFESTDARHAFPCYDEPALKAKFTIRINHGARFNAISNMPETRVENPQDGTATTSFAETPLVSTYLIAFIVSDFQYKTNTNNPNLFRHRVYSRPADVETTQFALEDGERVLSSLENYLKVNYTLPKMDQVAVPDFNAGAMENWGLVTYREQYLLWNASIHEFTRHTFIVTIISHEFGHQWFGNLVTPTWWNYIWLNEGFATLFEHIGTDLVHPEWDIWHYFVTRTVQSVLKNDAKIATRPMSYYVESPESISKLFDNIAYAKSGSVLRMFQHALTENTFKKALTNYLNKHAFKAATENDLFDALDAAAKEDKSIASNLDVHKIFSSWSNQKGYPLLKVERNYVNKTITLTQRRYFTGGVQSNDTSLWWIPYNYASNRNPNFNVTSPDGWLNTQGKIVEGKWSSEDWVLFNKQQTGVYRVLYDENNWRLLSKHLNSVNFTTIHTINRAQILDDLYEFSNEGLLKAKLFFPLFSYLKQETEYAPWVPAQNAILALNRLIRDSKQYHLYRYWVASLTEKYFNSTGLEDLSNEKKFQKYSRVIATNLACEFGVEECLTSTHSKLKQALKLNQELPPNTREIIYNNGIRNATAEEAGLLWNRFLKATLTNDRISIVSSFGYIQNHELLENYLNRTIVEYENVIFSKYERVVLFNSVYRTQHGLSLCIRLLQNHAADANKQFGNLNPIVGRLAYRVTNHKLHQQFDDLLKHLKKENLITDHTVNGANKLLSENFNWISTHQGAIESWLSNPNEGSSSSMVISSMTLVLTTVLYFILY